MYHYRARMYDSSLGRFCSKDPIGYEAGSNCLFEYCHSQPYSYVDPWGKQIYVPIPPGHRPRKQPHQPTNPLKPDWPILENPFEPKIPTGLPPIPEMPPGPGPVLRCAGATCIWITTDTSFPDPSDVCVPKWICYAVGGTIAGVTIICMTDAEALRGRLKELGNLAAKLRDTLKEAMRRKGELEGQGRVEEMEQLQDYIDTLNVRIEAIQETIDNILRQLGL